MKTPRQIPKRGSALLITLGLVVIVTVIAVAAILLAGNEAKFSASRLNIQQSEMMTEEALAEVVGKLNRIPLDTQWAAAPGRIRYWNGSSWSDSSGQINLYSEGTDNTDNVELNVPLTDGSYSIIGPNAEFPSAPSMKVPWIYVLSDGTVSPTKPPAGSAVSAVGRYAYWVDLENARANINTAGLAMTSLTFDPSVASYSQMVKNDPWAYDTASFAADGTGPTFSNSGSTAMTPSNAQKFTPQYLTGHPSSVDLSFLDNITAQQSLDTFRFAGSYFLRQDARFAELDPSGALMSGMPTTTPDTTVHFFNQPEDWQMVVGKTNFQANKGYITVRGRTPELNPWGLPKMVLSTIAIDGSDTGLYNDANLTMGLTSTFGQNWLTLYDPDTEESRPVQVPMIDGQAMSTQTAYRRTFRDISAVDRPDIGEAISSEGTLSALFASLTNLLTTPPPGFTAGWSSGSAAEQNAMEIALRLNSSGSLETGGAYGLISFNPADNNTGNLNPNPLIATSPPTWKTSWSQIISGVGGPLFPSGKRRWAADTEALLNEIVMNAEPIKPSTVPSYLGGASTDFPTSASPVPPTFFSNPFMLHGGPVAFLSSYPQNKPSADFSNWGATPEVIALYPQFELMSAGNETANATWSNGSNGYFTGRFNAGPSWYVAMSDIIVTAYVNGATTPTWGPVSFNVTSNASQPAAVNVCAAHGLVVAGLALTTPISVPANLDARDGKGNGYTTLPLWAATGGTNAILVGPFDATAPVTVQIQARFTYYRTYGSLYDYRNRTAMSVPGIVDPSQTSIPQLQSQLLSWSFNIPPNSVIYPPPPLPSPLPPPVILSQGYQIEDPRLGPLGLNASPTLSSWKLETAGDTLGGQNDLYASATEDTSTLMGPDGRFLFVRSVKKGVGQEGGIDRQTASRILGMPGVGYLQGISTGTDTNKPWQTLSFGPSGMIGTSPPDWMLWSYFYVPFDRSVYNNTDGKININATMIGPNWTIPRTKPLQALIGNRYGADAASLAASIATASSNPSWGAPDMFVYPGQVCEVPGMSVNSSAATPVVTGQALVRDLADLVTTQCSDFRVFAVGQTIKQDSSGTIHIMAEDRSEATLSRSPDTGQRGYVFPYADTTPSTFPFWVITRGAYENGGAYGAGDGLNAGPGGTKFAADVSAKTVFDAAVPANAVLHGQGWWGKTGTIDLTSGSDNWLIPQKIEITSLKKTE